MYMPLANLDIDRDSEVGTIGGEMALQRFNYSIFGNIPSPLQAVNDVYAENFDVRVFRGSSVENLLHDPAIAVVNHLPGERKVLESKTSDCLSLHRQSAGYPSLKVVLPHMTAVNETKFIGGKRK